MKAGSADGERNGREKRSSNYQHQRRKPNDCPTGDQPQARGGVSGAIDNCDSEQVQSRHGSENDCGHKPDESEGDGEDHGTTDNNPYWHKALDPFVVAH